MRGSAVAPLAALAVAFGIAFAIGCAAGDASGRGAAGAAARDGTTERTAVPVPDMPPPLGSDDAADASVTWNVGDAAIHLPSSSSSSSPSSSSSSSSRPPVPEPAFGSSESVKPGDRHAFRLAVALRAARASASGAKVMRMLSVIPEVVDAKRRTAIDPFADGEWLLVYGAKVAVPGPNANVVKHARAEALITTTMADGGFAAWDAGVPASATGTSAPASTTGTANAVRAEIYGVNDVVLRPQAGIAAVVPGDRARDLARALATPIDPGVKPGELARAFVAEPAKLLRFLPADVVRASVIVKPAADGGLDASAEGECPDPAQCAAAATSLAELIKTQNSLVVRIVTKNLLGGLAVRADGTKLKATLHAAPDQVDAALNLLRAQLGLPGDHTYAGP